MRDVTAWGRGGSVSLRVVQSTTKSEIGKLGNDNADVTLMEMTELILS